MSGDVENTNASWLSRRLASIGLEVTLLAAVRDDIDEIAVFLRAESPRAGYIFVTGGLGGTPDDITREAVARAFGVLCEEIEWLAGDLRGSLRAQGPRRLRSTLGLPSRWCGADPNPLGGAPGFVLGNVYVFPGLPSEMKAMFDEIAARFRGRPVAAWRCRYRTGEGQIVRCPRRGDAASSLQSTWAAIPISSPTGPRSRWCSSRQTKPRSPTLCVARGGTRPTVGRSTPSCVVELEVGPEPVEAVRSVAHQGNGLSWEHGRRLAGAVPGGAESRPAGCRPGDRGAGARRRRRGLREDPGAHPPHGPSR